MKYNPAVPAARGSSNNAMLQVSGTLQATGVAHVANTDFHPAFEKLYHTCSSPLHRLALSRMGNFHDAEDAVQEAFLKAYRNAPSFAGQATLSTWLYRILINVCHDFSRSQRRRSQHQKPADSSEVTSQLVVEDHPLRLSLEKLLRRLNPRYSSVLLLFEIEGRQHSEIAALLRITEGTSKTRLSHARRKLKAMLSAAKQHRMNNLPS